MDTNYLEKLRKIRREQDYTQEYMAFRLGISQKMYSDIENGKTILKHEMMDKITEILGMMPSDICPLSFICIGKHKKKNEVLKDLLKSHNIEIPD